MAIREIPLDPSQLAFKFKVDLDNITYSLQFTFNRREELWKMNIQNEAGEDLVVGLTLFVRQRLLKQFQHDDRLPQGELFLINLVDDVTPPNIDNLGSDVILLYQDAVG